jgi:C4-dicarboxylate-binding protein DctP
LERDSVTKAVNVEKVNLLKRRTEKERKMLKRILIPIMIIGLTIVCYANISYAKPKSIKLAHVSKSDTFGDALHAAAVGFKFTFEKRTAGEFEVSIYPRGTLGKEIDTMEALKNNVIQVSLASSAGFFRAFPAASIFFMPYAFKNERVALEVMNGPFGQKLLDAFTEKTGIKALAYIGGYSWMNLTNNKRPIKSLEDMKGLKFRVMDPLGTTMFKSLGASATPIAFSETYTSLQTGVVDGQTNPSFLIANMKFNEVQKYMTIGYSQWGVQMILVNKQWYESLSAEDRRNLRDASKSAGDAVIGLSLLLEDKFETDLNKAGMEINVLDQKEVARFRAAASPACLAWAREVMGENWTDEFLKAIDDAEKKLGYK